MDEIAKHARTRIEKGSKSFAAASRIFGPNTRASVHMLYCWCRHCDDEVDDQELGFASGKDPTSTEERLKALESKTRAAMVLAAGSPVVAVAVVAGGVEHFERAAEPIGPARPVVAVVVGELLDHVVIPVDEKLSQSQIIERIEKLP